MTFLRRQWQDKGVTDPLRPPPELQSESLRAAARQARTVPDLIRMAWQNPAVRLLGYAVIVPLGLLLGLRLWNLLASVLITVFLAYGLAFLCNPLLVWLEQRRVPRMVGVLLLLVLGATAVTLLVMTLTGQVNGLIQGLPDMARRIKDLAISSLDHLDRIPGAEGLKESLNAQIDKQLNGFQENAGSIAERIIHAGPDVVNTVGNLVGWLGQVGFIVTLAMYFMLDFGGAGRSVLNLAPVRWQPTLLRLSEDVSQSFGSYLRGQMLMMVSSAVLVTLGLLALKVPNALALGLLSGLVSLIPYVGIVLGAVVAMLQALSVGTGTVALVALLFFILNQVQGNVLGPLIMGKTMQLSAAAILIALLVGLALGGVGGALLAIPLATLFKRWLERYWLPSRAHEGAPGDPAPTVLGEPHLDPATLGFDEVTAHHDPRPDLPERGE